MTREEMVNWLRECANYFDNRPSGGEDAAHWASVYNAENARKIADFLDGLAPPPLSVGQMELLGRDFEKVLHDNLPDLYARSDDAASRDGSEIKRDPLGEYVDAPESPP
jgi:hypothetical protein